MPPNKDVQPNENWITGSTSIRVCDRFRFVRFLWSCVHCKVGFCCLDWRFFTPSRLNSKNKGHNSALLQLFSTPPSRCLVLSRLLTSRKSEPVDLSSSLAITVRNNNSYSFPPNPTFFSVWFIGWSWFEHGICVSGCVYSLQFYDI